MTAMAGMTSEHLAGPQAEDVEKGWFVYGVVESSAPAPDGLTGLDEGPVWTFECGRVAAVATQIAVEDVNAAIKKHLRSTDLDVVVITKDAAAFRRAMQAGTPSTIQYASPPPKEILDEDKLIGRYSLDLGDVRIVPADTIFEK